MTLPTTDSGIAKETTSADYLEELKDLIRLHLASQGEQPEKYNSLLGTITSDTEGDEHSWANQWIRQGDLFSKQRDKRRALLCYNFGRFPFVNGPDRAKAHQKCVNLFQFTRVDNNNIRKVRVPVGEDREMPVYTSGKWSKRTPLLLVIGGIVSIKEQWGDMLTAGSKLGFAVCVAEFPSVGENPLKYDAASYSYLRLILDHLAQGEQDLNVYMVGISFSGELVIKLAAEDQRVKGIICSGCPVLKFFQDAQWWEVVPETTKRTLAHLMGCEEERVFSTLQSFTISNATLKKVNIPVNYIACRKDDIVPFEEAAILSSRLQHIRVLELNDHHGGPNSMPLIKKFIPMSLMEVTKGKWHPLTLAFKLMISAMLGRYKANIRFK